MKNYSSLSSSTYLSKHYKHFCSNMILSYFKQIIILIIIIKRELPSQCIGKSQGNGPARKFLLRTYRTKIIFMKISRLKRKIFGKFCLRVDTINTHINISYATLYIIIKSFQSRGASWKHNAHDFPTSVLKLSHSSIKLKQYLCIVHLTEYHFHSQIVA